MISIEHTKYSSDRNGVKIGEIYLRACDAGSYPFILIKKLDASGKDRYDVYYGYEESIHGDIVLPRKKYFGMDAYTICNTKKELMRLRSGVKHPELVTAYNRFIKNYDENIVVSLGRIWTEYGCVIFDEGIQETRGFSLNYVDVAAFAELSKEKGFDLYDYEIVYSAHKKNMQYLISVKDFINAKFSGFKEMEKYKDLDYMEKHPWFARVPDGNGMSGSLVKKLTLPFESCKPRSNRLATVNESRGILSRRPIMGNKISLGRKGK